jgi:hypothetical protein
MANGIHKGSEFHNISETWDQNERKLQNSNAPQEENVTGSGALPQNDFEQLIRDEAAEYDNEAKADQLLSGERATLNDDVDADDSGE